MRGGLKRLGRNRPPPPAFRQAPCHWLLRRGKQGKTEIQREPTGLCAPRIAARRRSRDLILRSHGAARALTRVLFMGKNTGLFGCGAKRVSGANLICGEKGVSLGVACAACDLRLLLQREGEGKTGAIRSIHSVRTCLRGESVCAARPACAVGRVGMAIAQ